mmetsp:Transcript_17221/g.32594  ORF Transcript_17221/g.32594 Transcript_17221/m.32594 type:complete len:90 (-) Transcript_17221:52-321(-)
MHLLCSIFDTSWSVQYSELGSKDQKGFAGGMDFWISFLALGGFDFIFSDTGQIHSSVYQSLFVHLDCLLEYGGESDEFLRCKKGISYST